MWFVITLLAFILLSVEVVITTFCILILLNGFPTLPDAFVTIYLTSSCFLILFFSAVDGVIAKIVSLWKPSGQWYAGVTMVLLSLIAMPILLIGLIAMLLSLFNMV